METALQWRDARRRGLTAGSILRRFGVEWPPVPVEAIAEAMGLRVQREARASAFELGRGSPVVFVNRDTGKVAQREVVARALGELIQGSGRAVEFSDELLVPLWMLHPIVTSVAPSTRVEVVAGWFEVTSTVMRRRLRYL